MESQVERLRTSARSLKVTNLILQLNVRHGAAGIIKQRDQRNDRMVGVEAEFQTTPW